MTLTEASTDDRQTYVGVSWDEPDSCDIDAVALVLNADGKLISPRHFVFFNNTAAPDGSAALIRPRKGDCEGFILGERVTVKLVLILYQSDHNGCRFDCVQGISVRVGVGVATNIKSASGFSTMALGRVDNGQFHVSGEGFVGGLTDLICRHLPALTSGSER
jgi:stress response protein SCP2